MAKYYLTFTPNPADSAGLTPTFLNFIKFDGTTLTPPGITTTNSGTGIYQFTYTPSFSISFRVDGFTTSLASNRYISGSLDVSDNYALDDVGSSLLAVSSTLVATGATQVGIGNTLLGIGNTVAAFGPSLSWLAQSIGSTASIYGGSAADPGTLYGYMKRIQEILEGNQTFNKSTGAWDIFSRAYATLLISKAVSNSATGVTRG